MVRVVHLINIGDIFENLRNYVGGTDIEANK